MKLIGNHHTKINIFLCEDNERHLEHLSDMVKRVAEKKQWNITLAAFQRADEMLAELEREQQLKNIIPHVVFADIEMPGMNGIELGKRIRHLFPSCYLIFTTAFEEYAVEGYETRAYRYLLKPITMQSVSRTLEQIFLETGRNKSLLLKEQGQEVIVPLKEIVYISAEDKYTIFHTMTSSFFDKISLKECENLLEKYGFYRIHRKYIVNMKYHKKIGRGKVALSSTVELPISRNREEGYRRCFMRLLEHGMLE